MLSNLPDTAAGKRLGKGEWAAAEGAIWHLPDDQVRAHGDTRFHRVVAGLDWGFVHPLACEVVGQTGSGRLAVVAEVYAQGRLVRDVIPALHELREKHHISVFYADPSEPAYILECQQAGLPVVPANNDVDPGIQAVATAIVKGMTVDPSCQGLLGEIPGYTWAPARGGGWKEEPIKINDDACDALRYAVMGFGQTWQTAVA